MNESNKDRDGSWTVIYSDHSGNAYRFSQRGEAHPAVLDYDPVTPEESSSGTYSGGDPYKGTLTPEEVERLWVEVRDLEASTAGHSSKRRMGTGSFRVTEAGGALRRFIVSNGPSRRRFDAFARSLRGLPVD